MVWVADLVLFIAIGLESWSFRTAFREANKSRGTRSLKEYIQDTRQPELPVVLLEDMGALLGLGLALGMTMAVVTGDGQAVDGVGSLAIGTLLLVIAVFLVLRRWQVCWSGSRRCPSRRRPSGRPSTPSRRRLDHPHAHAGPGRDELLVAVKIGVRRDLPSSQLAVMMDEGEQRSARRSTAKWIYRARHRAGTGRGSPARTCRQHRCRQLPGRVGGGRRQLRAGGATMGFPTVTPSVRTIEPRGRSPAGRPRAAPIPANAAHRNEELHERLQGR